MDKEFVSYVQAVDLKELGFKEDCFKIVEGGPIDNFPHKQLHVPLKQQAFRWFREKYELYSFVFKFDEGFGYETYKEGITQTNESFDTYEEAEQACLDKLIEIVKNKC